MASFIILVYAANPKHPQHKLVSQLNFAEYIDWRIEEDPISQFDMLADVNGKLGSIMSENWKS